MTTSEPSAACRAAGRLSTIRRVARYARYAWRGAVTRRPDPLILGLVLTDRCNLSCAGCRVANTGRPDMTWGALIAHLENGWRRGLREVYFSGGEPTLWRDGLRGLQEALDAARCLGFYHVHVYTNGTRGLNWKGADLVWVGMDGLPETFSVRRGDHFAEVEQAIRTNSHPTVAVIYTIDRRTESGIEVFLRWVQDTRLPVIGVMFYFHTPYYGVDSLFLSAGERAPIIDRIRRSIRAGLPVLNSRAGLDLLENGKWPRRVPTAVVVDVDGESVCCRAPAECCPECGYAACTEMVAALRLRPTAVVAMGRYW